MRAASRKSHGGSFGKKLAAYNSKQAQAAGSARASAVVSACFADIYFICLRFIKFISSNKLWVRADK
jgi:hypothetical protein